MYPAIKSLLLAICILVAGAAVAGLVLFIASRWPITLIGLIVFGIVWAAVHGTMYGRDRSYD